jgi:hypothetical protein
MVNDVMYSISEHGEAKAVSEFDYDLLLTPDEIREKKKAGDPTTQAVTRLHAASGVTITPTATSHAAPAAPAGGSDSSPKEEKKVGTPPASERKHHYFGVSVTDQLKAQEVCLSSNHLVVVDLLPMSMGHIS